MDKKFVELYKRVCPDASNAQIDNRMSGIREAMEGWKVDWEFDDLVKIFVNKPMDNKSIESFGHYFYNNDYSFDLSNKEELSILAGYILHKSLEDSQWKVDVAILLVLFSVVDPGNSYGELYREAFNVLEARMRSTRATRKDIKSINLKRVNIKALKSLIEDERADLSKDAVYTILDELDNNIRMIGRQNEYLYNEVRKFREESQILSWIIGEWCNWRDAPLKQLEERSVALLLGRELAGFVEEYPGPLAARAFLARMLSKTVDYSSNEFSLAEMVNTLSSEDKGTIVSEFETSSDISYFPIAVAIKQSQSVQGKKEWFPLYDKEMGISPDEIKKDCVGWAYQFYLENIGTRVLPLYSGF